MLVNLVPEFLAVLAAPDPAVAYRRYVERHRPILAAYWQNYVLDPDSPHAADVIAGALRADRTDLHRLLEDVDVSAVAEDALQRTLVQLEADCPVDLYLTVGVGAANAGELVVGGRGIAFVCLEHFTGRANPQTFGLGLARICCRCGSRTKSPMRFDTHRQPAAPTCDVWCRRRVARTTTGTPGAGPRCESCW